MAHLGEHSGWWVQSVLNPARQPLRQGTVLCGQRQTRSTSSDASPTKKALITYTRRKNGRRRSLSMHRVTAATAANQGSRRRSVRSSEPVIQVRQTRRLNAVQSPTLWLPSSDAESTRMMDSKTRAPLHLSCWRCNRGLSKELIYHVHLYTLHRT